MAPVPYPFQYEASPAGFLSLLHRVWRRLYPQGEDPVFHVYREELASFVYEYRAEVFLYASSPISSITRSAKGGPACTPEQAILYASLDALVDLRHQEVGMQLHPGLSHYPTLTPSGQVLFPPDSECDRTSAHLARYMVAQYELIISLAEELARSREALASISLAQSPPPPSPAFVPVTAPPPSPSLALRVAAPVDTRRETAEEWSELVATPAAPMLSQHPPPPPEGEPSRQRRRIDSSSLSSIHVVSSGSEDGPDGSATCQCPLHTRE